MSQVEIPQFGQLLAPYLGGLPPEALPFMLSQLERTAADRYRGWAEQVPGAKTGLLACAEREDEIANRVEALFPPSDEHRELVLGLIPEAKAVYYEAFDGYSPVEQMTIQANAERQGANAWQNLKQAHPELGAEMDELSAIELQSADYLDDLLANVS